MKIEFATEGGVAYFPGLSKATVVETGELGAAEAARLEGLVEAAGFFGLPAEANAARRGAADYQRYAVTIERGEERHSVRFVDPIADADQRALVEALRAVVKERRGRERGDADG